MGDQTWLVMIGGMIAIALGMLSTKYLREPLPLRKRSSERLHAPVQPMPAAPKYTKLFIIQISLIAVAMLIVYDTTRSLTAGSGLPRLNQWLSWGVLGMIFEYFRSTMEFLFSPAMLTCG